jgi:hypothetical protein
VDNFYPPGELVEPNRVRHIAGQMNASRFLTTPPGALLALGCVWLAAGICRADEKPVSPPKPEIGQIAAIFITDTALINYPGDDNTNDEVWTVMTGRVPDLETKVTLVLAPHKEQ